MAEERDPQVSAAYLELGAEEPPRALDEAILSAAHRQTRPWTQRYAVPLGLAAVLVLSVTVTLRMQHEQPVEKEQVSAAPAQEPVLKLKPEVQLKAAEPPARQRQAKAEAQDAPKAFAEARREQAPPAPAPASAPMQAPVAATAPSAVGSAASRADRMDFGRSTESSVTGSNARQAEERTSRDAEAAARAPQVGPLRALAKSSAEAPEPELERIAQLRREGKHEEADKALAEFRKRFPDYPMTDAMRERVERR
jgi:hypothetical protein